MQVIALLALVLGTMTQMLLHGHTFTRALCGIVCGTVAVWGGLRSAREDQKGKRRRWLGGIVAGMGAALMFCSSFHFPPAEKFQISSYALSGQHPGVVYRIVELPSPNTGEFSFKQAEVRKDEILSNVPSPKLKRPVGADMCIHIEKDDTITVYDHILGDFPKFSQPRTNQSVAEVLELLHAVPVCNRALEVLITSDVKLKRSKTIYDVLKVLFVPGIQILYVNGSEQGSMVDRG